MIPGFLVLAKKDGHVTAPDSLPAADLNLNNFSVWADPSEHDNYLQVSTDGPWTILQIGEFYNPDDKLSDLCSAVNDKSALPEGQYSAVLINSETEQMIMVSDPTGVRSVFYGYHADHFVVASSPGQLRRLHDNTEELRDQTWEAYLLRFGYLPPGKCVYHGYEEAAPATITCWAKGKITQVTKKTPPATETARDEHTSDKAYRENLYKLLQKVIRKQAGGERRVAVLLGGFDSALVAALLNAQAIEVETFSFDYGNSRFNQPHTEILADFLNIQHHWVAIDHTTIEQGLKNFGSDCPFPTLWPGYVIQTHRLMKEIRARGIRRCFSGDGCDTAFMGYPSTHHRGQVYKNFPTIADTMSKTLIRLLDAMAAERFLGHPGRVLKGLLRAATIPPDGRAFRSFQIFDPGSFPRLIGQSYDWQVEHEELLTNLETTLAKGSYEKQIYAAKSLFSPNRCKLWSSQDIFQGLICSPYMDPELKLLAALLPDEILRENHASEDIGKKVLVEMTLEKELLPDEIVKQPKLAAVVSPIDHWMANEIRPTINRLARQLPFRPDPAYLKSLINDLAAERFYRNYLSNDQVVGIAISLLITYACFFGKAHEA